MDFGLWVEPEMVNPDSRSLSQASGLGAEFSRPAAHRGAQSTCAEPGAARCARLCFGFLDKLLTENDIAFLKWDYNRNWSEPGWDQLPAAEQKRVYVEFTRNLYSILAELRAKHPKVEIESCSGGGGRVDLGILQYTDEVWPSDNTDPFDRLTQQDGFTYAYTPQVMMAWVTDSPHWLEPVASTSLSYRMLSSMQGSLGIGANIAKWSDDETGHGQTPDRRLPPGAADHRAGRSLPPDFAAQWQRVLGHADRESATRASRWSSPSSTPRRRAARFPRLKLKGLDPAADYALTSIEGKARPGDAGNRQRRMVDEPRPGYSATSFRGDFQAAAFRLDKK